MEYSGSSLYASFSQKVTRAEVLKITLGLGGNEIAHFLAWIDFVGNAIQGPPFKFDSAQSPTEYAGPTFRHRTVKNHRPRRQSNLSFPVPADLISSDLARSLTVCRLDDRFCGAVATIQSFSQNGLFVGQSPEFLRTLGQMAEAADDAVRK
jgi:hypothetical protein